MRTLLEYLDIPSFVYGIIFLFLILVIRSILKEKPTEQLKAETGLHDWVQKKDLIYWLIIVMVCAISHYTYKYKDSEQLISHWSFGGTIVSIILAIIAIVYTFYDNFTSKSSVQQLENSAGKIKDITEKLDSSHLVNSSNKIGDISVQLEVIIQNMDNQLNNINRELNTIRGMNTQSFLDVKEKLEEMVKTNFQGKSDSEEGTKFSAGNPTELKNLLSAYIGDVFWNRISLVCILLINKKNLHFTSSEVGILATEISKLISEDNSIQAVLHQSCLNLATYNIINLLKSCGLTFDNNTIKLNSELEDILEQLVSNLKLNEKSSYVEKNINKSAYEIASAGLNKVYDLS
ncbi:hypothetical protein [Bacillus paranthracis]|uniref:hypothetical protein n=1 Tax=Bacillus paranthracis TaxID=2026186 RepID=UPI0028418AE1|nr:hypothetical protein [Bacillus paranthracis]MDR4163681.1 hypothetical protein [Bacillus paranthracis]